jgi:hypothetical protein
MRPKRSFYFGQKRTRKLFKQSAKAVVRWDGKFQGIGGRLPLNKFSTINMDGDAGNRAKAIQIVRQYCADFHKPLVMLSSLAGLCGKRSGQ